MLVWKREAHIVSAYGILTRRSVVPASQATRFRPTKIIKTPAQIEGIRESGKLNVAVLDYVAEHIRAGITTEEIDQWVYDLRQSTADSGTIKL